MMHKHRNQVRVRYAETDRMGYLHHGNYPAFFEEARTEWLRSLGIQYRHMEESGIMLTVVALNIKYKQPAKYDELLTIETCLVEHSGVKVRFEYQVFNEAELCICEAKTTLAFINSMNRKPCRAPDYFHKALENNK